MAIEQSIAPGPQLAPIPIPQNTGAPIAEGVEALGEGFKIHQEHQDATLAASQGAALANANLQMDTDLKALQDAHGNDPDYLDQARQLIDGYSRNFEAGFGKNMRVRQQFMEAQAKTFGAAEHGQITWLTDRQNKALASDSEDAMNVAINHSNNDPLNSALADATNAQIEATVRGLGGLVPDPDAMIRKYQAAQAAGRYGALIDGGYFAQAKTLRDAGAFDHVEPAQLEVLDRRSIVQQVAAKRAQNTQLNQVLTILNSRRNNGEILSPAEMAQGEAIAAATGDPTKMYDAHVWAVQNNTNLTYGHALPIQISDEMHRLQALGDKSTPDQQIELKQLPAILQRQNDQIASDPHGFMASIGRPAPSLNPDDPTSWQALGQWADRSAHDLGRPINLLTQEQAAPLIQTIAKGKPDDQYNAALSLLKAGSYAPQLLDQVAPNNPGFRAAMSLSAFNDGGAAMREALDGPAAIEAFKTMLQPGKDKLGHALPGPEAIFAADMHGATMLLSAQQVEALRYNNLNRYAARARATGNVEQFDPGIYRQVEQANVGGRQTGAGWFGGTFQWRGENVIAPQGMPQALATRTLSRANPASWEGAATNGLSWNGGRTYTQAELSNLIPTWTGRGTIYALRHGNTTIRAKGGGQFEFDMAKLANLTARQPVPAAPLPKANRYLMGDRVPKGFQPDDPVLPLKDQHPFGMR